MTSKRNAKLAVVDEDEGEFDGYERKKNALRKKDLGVRSKA